MDYCELLEVDKFLLHQLSLFSEQVKQAYEDYNFAQVSQLLNDFVSLLSSFFFESFKDRLYADSPKGKKRRSCQHVLFHTLEVLGKVISPILCHTSQDVFNHHPLHKHSPFLNYSHLGWSSPPVFWKNSSLATIWTMIERMRFSSNWLLQNARQDALIKSSLEATLFISVPLSHKEHPLSKLLFQQDLSNIFNVSEIQLSYVEDSQLSTFQADQKYTTVWRSDQEKSNGFSLSLRVSKSQKHKCPRCWNHTSSHQSSLCDRCQLVLKESN